MKGDFKMNAYTNEQLIEMYISYLQSNRASKDTISNFVPNIRKLGELYNLQTVNKFNLTEYKNILLDKNYADQTLRSKITAIKSFFRFMKENDVREDNPSEFLRVPRLEKIEKTYELKGLEEYKQFIEDKTIPMKVRMCLCLGTFQGLRRAEICDLDVSSIDFENNILTVKQGKGLKTASIVLSSYAKKMILEYVEINNITEGYLIRNKYNQKLSKNGLNSIFRSAKEKSSLDWDDTVTFHSSRHRFCSTLVNANIPLPTIAQLSRHSNINTLKFYSHNSHDEKKVIIDSVF